MIEEKYIQLMHQEIDGMNSTNESEDLRSFLSINTEAQRYYEELLEVCHRLNKVPQATPSPDLAKRIIASLPFERYAHKRFSLIEFMAQIFTRRSGISFASGFAIGALLVFFWIRSAQETDPMQLTGALNGRESMAPSTPVSFNLKEAQGDVILSHSSGKTRMDIHLISESRVEIAVAYDHTRLRLDSFYNDASEFAAQLADSVINISHVREGHYAILFERVSPLLSRFRLSIRRHDHLLFEKSLE